MKKIIFLLVFIFSLFSFSSSYWEYECKEEIIKNALRPIFSPNWLHFAYVTKWDEWRILIKDWKQIWWSFRDINSLTFSYDWKSIAYKTEKFLYKDSNKIYIKRALAKDWKEFVRWDIEDFILPYFSPNWDDFVAVRWFFINGELYSSLFGEWDIPDLVDWQIWNRFKKASNPVFSSDWKHFAYIATESAINMWEQIIIKDWKRFWEKFKLMYWLRFVPKTEKLVYVVKKDNWNLAIINDWKEIEWNFNNISLIRDLKFSPDWNSFVYWARLDNWKEIIIKDWKEIWAEFKNVSNPIFSSDWKNFSYIAEKDNWKIVVIKNGEQIWWDYISVDNLIFSPDWNNFIFIAEPISWKKVMIKNWEEVVLDYEYSFIDDPTFSSDWKCFAYTVIEDYWKNFIVKEFFDNNNNNNNNLDNEKEILKNKIINKDWKGIINSVDNLVKKNSNQKLKLVLNKINKLDLNSKKYLKYKDIFEYLELIINEKINN